MMQFIKDPAAAFLFFPLFCIQTVKKVWPIGYYSEYRYSSVLPGLEAASPPIKQKSTAIWRKLTAFSHFTNIPLLFRYFLSFCIG
jgi:hypothetical protein